MRKISAIIMTLMLTALALCGCSKVDGAVSSSASGADPADSTMTEEIIDNFMSLAQIPRGTYNEAEVSNYLLQWAKERGYEALQDEQNNVIFDVPATKGCEDYPRTALQCHMDMVVVADEGYSFDPLKDPIKVLRDENRLYAEHTSLGADDGIGIAITQYLVENAPVHGPLRVIITTDEEKTQTGVEGLDPAVVADVKYLINIDHDKSQEITISSAGGVNMVFTGNVSKVPTDGDAAFEICIDGSAGGHSGIDINKGRVNSIVALCDLLWQLKENGVEFRIAKASGGDAMNAIPVSAKAVIVTEASRESAIRETADEYLACLKKTYETTNPDLSCSVTKEAVPASTMSAKDTEALICFGQNAVSGVYTMSQKVEGFVESSSNLGILAADTREMNFEFLVRSSEEAAGRHITGALTNLGDTFGFMVQAKEITRPWPAKEDSVLAAKAAEIYERQNGVSAAVLPVHGGLECGTFVSMNPELDIISVGPDTMETHTTGEYVVIDSIPKTTKMVQEVLAELRK